MRLVGVKGNGDEGGHLWVRGCRGTTQGASGTQGEDAVQLQSLVHAETNLLRSIGNGKREIGFLHTCKHAQHTLAEHAQIPKS